MFKNVENNLHVVSLSIMMAQDFWKSEKVGSLIMVVASEAHPIIAKAS